MPFVQLKRDMIMKNLVVFIVAVSCACFSSKVKSQNLSASESPKLSWIASASFGIGGPGAFGYALNEYAFRFGGSFYNFYVGGAFSAEREQRFQSGFDGQGPDLVNRAVSARGELGYSLINNKSFQLRPYLGFGALFTTLNNPLQTSEWRTTSSSYLSPGIFSTLFPFSQLPLFLGADIRYEIFFSFPPAALYRLVGSVGVGVVF